MLTGKNIVIGVSGGIAAYKAADIVSRLKKLNASVYVIMTKGSTEFIKPLTFQSLSQNYVVTDMFEDPKTWDVEHIALAKRADLFLIAPATANIIGKIANGIADDMLTTTVMATEAPVFIAPAMNTKMYENVIVQENIAKLAKRGYHFIDPAAGRLACGDVGAGKLAAPEDIVDVIKAHFTENRPLEGVRIMVTAGPTREPVDPVRYITNHSSGKMGYAIAKQAQLLGAEVILISGPTHLETPNGVKRIDIVTTSDMLEAVQANMAVDVIIKAAAPSDYKPMQYQNQKIKKGSESIDMKLVKNPDILKSIVPLVKDQIVVGFAAETQNVEGYAMQKLQEKKLDFIVANDVTAEGAGFDKDTNIVTIFEANGTKSSYECLRKDVVAGIILDKVIEYLKKQQTIKE
ncbi:bifunctional phosphopantothenoylcysteine decarboxylase/phosphopantothenate--cysteine ligase CoaBC [Fusibacter paucivorans]|uniref:Coenzyme A biosynthesis bifunctional protein CoaBC n=1 Tax=Fusibacter paucivorans TaxID=76009 RepID=A0ABS5PQI1_9FIRM|nr:bifunctional phosphopantothenoylcysteine decarboxylase/phosphopantothenate--cysteine ligase CoaBC [Fusibacter paucivorans]MBS7527428.1 bifunctional phosphopantothenoylcysteine decarboxylase/phosphopantothenate--cysteine ligase CoaBC [Fusibacter paucivorans]